MRTTRESVASWLRLVLRRMGDERGLVGAAFLVALVAATVAAACVVYPDAALRRGLLDVLAGADPAASSVAVTSDVGPGTADAADGEVTAALAQALGPAAEPPVRTARSEAWQLPGGEGMEHPPLTYLAWDEGLAARTALVAGTAAGTTPPDGRPEAVVTSGAAAALGVAAGSVLEVASRLEPSRRLQIRIAGIVDVLDPADPAWGGDVLATDGAAQPGSFPLRGPLFVDRATLLELGTVSRASLAWRAMPAFERIGPDDLAAIRAGVGGLQGHLQDRVGDDGPVTVATDLPAILDAAGAGVATGRSGATLIALQLLLLAAYALVLLAALVVERRRPSTELAAARGAPAASLVGLAALEGVLVALPAVLLGPLLAVGLATLLGAAWGGVAEPRVTPAAVALAAAAGAIAVAGMVLPTAASLGPVARLRGSLAGRGAAGLAERTGIDLALLALAALGLWQLREAGTVLASSRTGGAAVDPLLAVAPAIGLLAGGLLALRVGPLVGAWLERAAGHAAGVVAPLAGHGIARRSAEGARAALLLVVATGIVLFATAYARTWQQSQRDQVAAAIPADLVGRAPTGPAVPADAATRAALVAAPGVREALPVVRETFAVGTAVRQGVLLAVPADASFAPPAAIAGDLVGARPPLTTLPLPETATSVRLALEVELAAVPSEDGILRPIPGAWTGLGTAVVLRDERGLLHRVAGPTGRLTGGRQDLEVPLRELAARSPGAGAPLEVVAVEATLTLPEGVAATGAVWLAGITAVDDGGDAVAVDGAPARRAWEAVRSTFGAAPVPVAGRPGDPLAVELAEPATGPVPVVLGFRPVELAAIAADPLTAVVDTATRDAAGVAVGDVLPLQRGSSATLPVRVAAVADVLPGATAGEAGASGGVGAVLVDLPTLSLADYGRDGSIPASAEWWLDADAGAEAAAEAAMTAAGVDRIRVRAAVERARLADPLARGTLGALGLAAGAAVVFAVVGFGAAAWRAVRVRRSERAVARALGLERGRTAAWQALELAFQLAVGIAGGIVLGLVLAWAVLPSVSLTPDGTAPVPAPVIVLPWDVAGIAIAAGLVGLAAGIVPLRRAGRPGALAADLREAHP